MRRVAHTLLSVGFFLSWIFSSTASHAENLRNREIVLALQSEKDIFYRFNHKHEFKNVGTINVKEKKYFVVYYEYDETWKEARARGGNFPHASHRILVFRKTSDGLTFLGSYSVDKAPIGISGHVIKFDYPDGDGNKIVFDDDGPRKNARLDGEYRGFGR